MNRTIATYHYRQEGKKTTVEDCLSIDANSLVHIKLMKPGRRYTTISWSSRYTGQKVGSCWVRVTIMDDTYVEFGYNQKLVKVVLSGYAPGFGGCRYFFHCPVCGRRRRTLHFYNGQIACRTCHDLTYRSCQEGHEFDRLYKRMAEDLNCSWRSVKRLIHYLEREAAKKPRKPRGRPKEGLFLTRSTS